MPCILVIVNDIFAYIFGISFGKTKLIDLSPKKTWEGFIGGFVSSVIWAIIVIKIFFIFFYLKCIYLYNYKFINIFLII